MKPYGYKNIGAVCAFGCCFKGDGESLRNPSKGGGARSERRKGDTRRARKAARQAARKDCIAQAMQ